MSKPVQDALKHKILRAEVLYSGLGTPRERGAVALQGERVVMVGSAAEVVHNYPEAVIEDAGFAISPPLVNAHTHLDLSTVPYFSGGYTDFIRYIIAQRGARNVAAVQKGLTELKASGVKVFGDIVANAEVMRFLLQERGVQGAAYWEVFAPDPADAERVFEETLVLLREFRSLEHPDGLKLGISPHTPHTVSAPLLQKLTRLARAEKLPMQIHVAESPEETLLQQAGRGPLYELLQPYMGSAQPAGKSPVAYLDDLGVLAAQPTLVHMVQVSEDDIKRVAKAGCTVVHCPRSNAALSCGRFPWELFAKHNVEVALGTDSKASSPDLNIVAEGLAARELHGARLSPLALVRAAVKGGYRALGLHPPTFARGSNAASLQVWEG